MSNPQQPELARSRRTPALDPDATATVLSAATPPLADPADGAVPEDNAPGHHPEVEQDKPVDKFVARANELAADAQADAETEHAEVPEYAPVVEDASPAEEVAAPPASSVGASDRADRLAALAGAPWGAASAVLRRLRNRV